jgi:hypothetical protein
VNDAKPNPASTMPPAIAPIHTNMSPLELSVEWWSRWSDILGISAIVITVILAVAGGLAWGFSWKASKLKDALLSEQIKNAPLKARVATATASIRLSVSVDVARSFQDRKASDGSVASLNFGKSQNFKINGGVLTTGTWTLFLQSDKTEQWGNASESEFFLEFHPLSFAPIDVPENVEELLAALDVVSLSIVFFPPDSEILAGTVALTLNGTTKKVLTIPKIRTDSFGNILILKGHDPTLTPLIRRACELK